MTRLFRLINVVGKRKIGVLLGLAVGVAACLVTPLTFSFLYSKLLFWVSTSLDGYLELPFTLLTVTFLMVLAAMLLLGLRIFVARVFRGRRYGPRRVILR